MLKQENLKKQLVSWLKPDRKKVVDVSLWVTDNIGYRCDIASRLA